MRQLLNYLKPLKNRIHLKYLISTASLALTTAVILDAVLVLFSKFVYIYGVFDIALAVDILIFSTGLIIWQFVRPSDYKTARIADSLGYKERFVTAMEALNKENPSELERLVINDAVDSAKYADFKALYSIKPDKYLIVAPAAALILFAAVYFLPVEPSEQLQEQEEMHELLDNAIEDMTNRIDTSNLTATQKKEVKKELNALKKELSRADNKTEAVNSIMKSQAQLKKIESDSENFQLKAIGSKLAENKATQNIGELLKSGNIEAFNEEINNISNNISSLSEQDIRELGKAFKEAAQSSEIDEETKQLLNELADTMNSELTDEQLADVSKNLDKFSKQINELAKQNKDIRDAIEKLNSDLADVSDDLSGNAGAGTQGQTGNTTGQYAQNGNGTGDNESTSSQGSTGVGKGSIPNANVYTANAKQYSDYDAELKQSGNEGTGEGVKNKVDGENGEIVPYTDVFSQYRDEAMNSVEQQDIPYGVKDIVRDYFSSLE